MRHVMRFIEDLRTVYEDHPLLRWLYADSADAAPSEESRLWPALYATYFIMAFSGLNRYHIHYDGPSDPERDTLNRHALEDMTHSRLYLKDFTTLDWNRHLPSRLSDILRWLLSDSRTLPVRKGTIELCSVLARARSPRIRYPAVEAIEAVGGMQFTAYTAAAARWSAQTGRDLFYFGDYHLGLETGRTVGDEGAFEEVELSQVERKEARSAVLKVYRILERLHDQELALAQEAISQHSFGPWIAGSDVPAGGGPEPSGIQVTSRPHQSQQKILAALGDAESALRVAAAEVFSDCERTGVTAGMLRTALLLWGPATLAETAVLRHAMPYPAPASTAQRAVNRLAAQITGDPVEVYADWARLRLDDLLPWSAEETLEFLWLDPATEPSRDLQAALITALAQDDPLVRYWAALAWVRLTRAQREILAGPASREGELRLTCPYSTTGGALGHAVLAADPRADALDFVGLPMGNETARQCAEVVENIRDALFRQLTAAADCIARHRFPALETG